MLQRSQLFQQAQNVAAARALGADALTASLCAGASSAAEASRWAWLQGVMEGLAGVGGGLVGLAVVFPLERLSALMQTDTSGATTSAAARLAAVLREEGWAGVYQGFQSGLVAMLVTMYIFFSAHGYSKRATLAALQGMRRGTGTGELGALADLFAATAAGAVTAVLSNPVWLVNTRMMLLKRAAAAAKGGEAAAAAAASQQQQQQQQQQQGFIRCFLSLYDEGGVGAYFKGVGPAMGTVSNTGLQFMAYEQLRKALLARPGPGPGGGGGAISGLEFFAIGAAAKCFSTVVTYPLQTITRRMQQPDGEDGKPRYGSTAQCARALVREEGFGALYNGLKPRLLQMVLQNAIKLYGFEMLMIIFRGLVGAGAGAAPAPAAVAKTA